MPTIIFNGFRYFRDKYGYYNLSQKNKLKHPELERRLHRAIWKSYNGEIPKGYHIHHKDHNKENNDNNNNGTYVSQTYCCSYNNINGKENNECYQSMCHKEIKDGHDISEAKELYKNSNGVNKTAYQRNLDNKKARFIKEKNTTNGKENQKRIVKGMADDELKNFNKEFNQCAKTLGFNKGLHSLLGNKRENKYMNRLLLH